MNTDGTATILQHLNTTATILGTERVMLKVSAPVQLGTPSRR
jgi:hypothetical protein